MYVTYVFVTLYVKQKYPDTKKYRDKPLEDRDLLKTLFEGTLATGDECFSPTHPMPPEIPRTRRVQVDDNDNTFGEDEPYVRQEDEPIYNPYFTDYTFQDVNNASNSQQKQQYTHASEQRGNSDIGTSHNSGKRRKRDSFEDPLVKEVHDLIGVIKSQVDEEESLKECLAVLNELRALGILDTALYLAALKAFGDNGGYRKLFLMIDDNELIVGFIHTIVGST